MNNKGVILLDMLFSLFLFLIIVSFIPPTLHLVLEKQLAAAELQNMEWQLFVSQLKKEVRISESIQVENNKLLLYADGENIIYEAYGGKIRRRVDFTGHEVTLQNVVSVQFSKLKNGVQVKIKDDYNQQNEAHIWSYLRLEGSSL